MSNLQHDKASRTRVINTFPAKDFGSDGDIVISKINGRGTFLCSKAGGMWYAANQMQELSRLGKASIKELTTNSLTVNKMANSENTSNRFIVNDGGKIKYRTGEQVVGDLSLPFDNIAYKTAYCSLGQYSDKDSCESNSGTWYYSENDSHDSISSTAENQLLTVGQSIGGVDAESTLTYDGSLLKITYDETKLDDNWRKNGYPRNIPQDEESMLTLERKNVSSSSNDAYMHMVVNSTGRSSILLHREDDSTYDGDWLTIYGDYGSGTYNGGIGFRIGETSAQNDIVSNRKLMMRTLNGDIYLKTFGGQTFIQDSSSNSIFEFDASYTHMRITDDSDTGDYFDITVAAHGATTISTLDDDATAGHLTLQPDGDLILDPVSGNTIINATDKLYLDGGGNTYIKEGSADSIQFYTAATVALQLSYPAASSRRIQFGLFSAGWAMQTATYNASDTEINFLTQGQKIICTFDGGDIADLNFTFPIVSGNFLLLLIQDGTGSRTVASDGWLAFDASGNAANGSATILWAGGTVPTLTTTADKADIISIFWDATNEKAYGTITYNF